MNKVFKSAICVLVVMIVVAIAFDTLNKELVLKQEQETSLLEWAKVQNMAIIYPELKADINAALEDDVVSRREVKSITEKYERLVKREAIKHLNKGE